MERRLLERCVRGAVLSREQASFLWGTLCDGKESPVRIAAVLGVFCARLPTAEEFSGMLDALLARAVSVDLGLDPVLDVCGTGGDGKDTFNISTATAFVVAGCGVRVAKHGNYAASSRVGSSNVLEALGVPLLKNPAEVRRCLDRAGICFLHAPLFHPALAPLAPIRRELGVRTVFNLLGPLANPARPTMQYIGVSDRSTMRLFAQVLADRGVEFCLVHADDGYDEISLTGWGTTVTNAGWTRSLPHEEGFERVEPADLEGTGDPREHAAVVEAILSGEDRSPRRAVVVANATRALMLARRNCVRGDILHRACRAEVEEAIDSGAAHRVLAQVRTLDTV